MIEIEEDFTMKLMKDTKKRILDFGLVVRGLRGHTSRIFNYL